MKSEFENNLLWHLLFKIFLVMENFICEQFQFFFPAQKLGQVRACTRQIISVKYKN